MDFMKTILNGIHTWAEGKINEIKKWADGVFVSHAPQSLNEEQKEQARKNIGIVEATDEDIIDLMLEMGMMPVVQDTDGFILTDSDNAIILI